MHAIYRLPKLAQVSGTRTILAIALGIPALLVIRHAIDVYRAVAPAPRRRIVETDSIPDELQESDALNLHVNPHRHVSLEDTRHIELSIPSAGVIRDEEILARFVQGFFGGRVFAIERGLLRMLKPELVNYRDLPLSAVPVRVWSIDQLNSNKLPPVNTLIFGGFMISNIQLRSQNAQHNDSGKVNNCSCVDIIFGSNQPSSGFAGVHCFSLAPTDRPSVVRLEYSHLSCNPSIDKPLKPDFIQVLHKVYAMALFREGVACVLSRVKGVCVVV